MLEKLTAFLPELISPVGLLLVLIISISVYYIFFSGPKNAPPAPGISLPFIGHLLHARNVEKFHDDVLRWADELGPVYAFDFGDLKSVIISTPELIREVLVKRADEFSLRPDDPFNEGFRQHKGIASAHAGELWKEHRRFALHSLRDFGMGKVSIEETIHTEADAILETLKKNQNKPYDARLLMRKAVSNIICKLVFNERYDYEDAKAQARLDYITLTAEVSNAIIFGNPSWIKYLPGDLFKVKAYTKKLAEMQNFYIEEMHRHRASLDKENVRDFIDAYLVEMDNQPKGSSFTEDQLCSVLDDLFFAGTDTTSTTLSWAWLLVLAHPNVQEKVRREIRDVLDEKIPTYKDRINLPYTEATLLEVQRYSSIAFVGLGNVPVRDTTINGCFIPKGTAIFPSIISVHYDPKTFPEPKLFKPERFYDAENNKVKNAELIMPFLVGRRSCLGESLAKMELFLFFVRVLQRYALKVPDGESKPDIEGRDGFLLEPREYKMCAVEE